MDLVKRFSDCFLRAPSYIVICMRVLYVAAEAAPLVKVGGLGDVAGSLPPALQRLGVDVRVAIPWYKDIDLKRWNVQVINGTGETTLSDTDIPLYLLGREVFAKTGEHKAILGTKEEERWFAKFSDAVVELIEHSEWKPQILHGNDWHVSEALVRIEQTSPQELSEWGYEAKNFATLLTVHNLSYHTNVLRKAILAADLINAVSPSYTEEILTKQFCEGLCTELNQRKDDLYGVLNGIDYGVWNPETDAHLSVNYGNDSWQEGKRRNKEELLDTVGLQSKDGMLLGFVGRLDPHQKGVLVLANAIEELVRIGCQIVVLGTGDRRTERVLKTACAKYPGMATAVIKYDEALAHRIYAGADALLIPSRFEPCGLIQLIAMKYGSLPIARAVGGLKDTIEDGRTGFLYHDYYSRGLVRAVRRAKAVYSDKPQHWASMVGQAMRENFSWDQSAKEYVKLYERALEKSKA